MSVPPLRAQQAQSTVSPVSCRDPGRKMRPSLLVTLLIALDWGLVATTLGNHPDIIWSGGVYNGSSVNIYITHIYRLGNL